MKFFTKNHTKDIAIVAVAIAIIFVGFKVAFGAENPFYVVSSGSMIPTLNVYDVIIVQGSIPFNQIKVGDIIVFNTPTTHNKVIVHRVAQIINQNPLEIRTKGDANLGSIPGIDLPITNGGSHGKLDY